MCGPHKYDAWDQDDLEASEEEISDGLLADCGIHVSDWKFVCRLDGSEECDWCPYRTMIGNDAPDEETVG